MSLLPPFLQNLMGYPVLTTGYLLAPRGLGTMCAMFLVGRLIGRVDARLLILAGLPLTALSLWQMTGFTHRGQRLDDRPTGLIQGLGPRLHLRAAQHRHLRDAGARAAHRGDRACSA